MNMAPRAKVGRTAVDAAERARLAARVKAIHIGLGLTQEEMAARCGIERTAYNKIVNGRDALTGIEAIRGLSRGWGVPMESVLEYLDETLDVGDITKLRETKAALDAEIALRARESSNLRALRPTALKNERAEIPAAQRHPSGPRKHT